MKGRMALVISVGALGGCASSSGVLNIGPDTFTISTSASPGRGGVPAAKRIAYEEATVACSQRGQRVLGLTEKAQSPTWTEGMANVTLNFRCLPVDDPEFKRQSLQSAPDQVIEMRKP